LARVRLRILERQSRFQEYLHLAEAEGQTEAFLTMLVKVGRAAEAAAKGKEWLTEPKPILALAKALFEHGEQEQALQVAEHGLELPPPSGVRGGWVAAGGVGELEEEEEEEEEEGDVRFAARRRGVTFHDSFGWSAERAELARWLRDTVVSLEQPGRALAAGRIAMEERPSLADYQALQAVAGEEWPGSGRKYWTCSVQGNRARGSRRSTSFCTKG
jgi:uncharacterized Zn finger protein